jgi:hypothetical protein
MSGVGSDMMSGKYDSGIGRMANVNRPTSLDVNRARAAQGALDPTNALSGILQGQPSNPYLDQQAAAITNNLTRNMNENVMPGIRSGAISAGQYGGSRQGIAEGLAASRLNQDLAPALSGLYGNAYEAAQGRQANAASQLNDQAFNTGTFNIGNEMNTDQFNANLGLQNNAQGIQDAQQRADLAMQGSQMASGGVQGQQTQYANMQALLGLPDDYDWNNLSKYAGMIYPGAGMGGTQTQSGGGNTGADIMGMVTGLGGMAMMA